MLFRSTQRNIHIYIHKKRKKKNNFKDTGVYTCEVTNKFGVTSHSAKVTVGSERESSGRRPLTVGYSADSEPESSSGSEMDDSLRQAGRRLRRLLRTRLPPNVAEEHFISADEGEPCPPDPQSYREDEDRKSVV